MKNPLPCPLATVDDNPKILRTRHSPTQLLRHGKEFIHDGQLLRCKRLNIAYLKLGNDKKVDWRLGSDVPNDDHILIFRNDIGGNFMINNF